MPAVPFAWFIFYFFFLFSADPSPSLTGAQGPHSLANVSGRSLFSWIYTCLALLLANTKRNVTANWFVFFSFTFSFADCAFSHIYMETLSCLPFRHTVPLSCCLHPPCRVALCHISPVVSLFVALSSLHHIAVSCLPHLCLHHTALSSLAIWGQG